MGPSCQVSKQLDNHEISSRLGRGYNEGVILPSTERVLAAVLLVAAILLIAPWQMVDPDALSHLAIGRFIVERGLIPTTDPFTFSAPHTIWSNPEWLGDATWYLLNRAGGERLQQIFKVLVICAGWLLALHLATRMHASPLLTAALMLIVLLGAPGRFTLRNHIHAYWLIPAYGLILYWARQDRRWLLSLIPLGILWANLHGSFPVGWVVILAALAQTLVDGCSKRSDLLLLGTLLAIHPLLALISPHGIHTYDQILDHLLGADIYRALITEWQPPGVGPSLLAHLPLHLLGTIGLLSFLPRCNRRQLGGFLLLLAGLSLGYSSRRFVPMLAVLAVPTVAVNLSRWITSAAPHARKLAVAALTFIALGLVTPVIWTARTDRRPHVLHNSSAPIAASVFIGDQASRGTRLFNPFNAGPWLLWHVGPNIRLYIDPRNNLGAKALQRYVSQILPDPAAFEREAERLRITLALVDLADGRMAVLNTHLDRSEAWSLIFFDGQFALFSRNHPSMRDLNQRFSYHQLRSRLEFEYLLDSSRQHLRRIADSDLAQLRQQGPDVAGALEAYRLLCDDGVPPPFLGGSPSPHAAKKATRLLERVLPQLPPSPSFMAYLATAMARQGKHVASRDVLRAAKDLFPGAPILRALESELAGLF